MKRIGMRALAPQDIKMSPHARALEGGKGLPVATVCPIAVEWGPDVGVRLAPLDVCKRSRMSVCNYLLIGDRTLAPTHSQYDNAVGGMKSSGKRGEYERRSGY